ncbi:hypothetical protein [Sphaerisporangium corydalis]|uniref:DUF3040 domain-containing protein n=1 Tax=Sphaerisporangium corydalis TaxID=1441875 RepID=A0ABV9ELJ6_9ACTN|nr:hypothetical protein [Sphaerisporangium corydalis]
MEQPQRLERDEVAAAMSARRELGPQYELELAESLVDRVNAVIDSRLAVRGPQRPGPDWAQMALGLGSLALSVPLTAIVSSSTTSTLPLMLIFGLIACVNLAYAIGKLGGHRRD